MLSCFSSASLGTALVLVYSRGIQHRWPTIHTGLGLQRAADKHAAQNQLPEGTNSQTPIQPLGTRRIRYEKETRLEYLVATIPKGHFDP